MVKIRDLGDGKETEVPAHQLVLAVRAIFDRFEGKAELRFEGEFYRCDRLKMTPPIPTAPPFWSR